MKKKLVIVLKESLDDFIDFFKLMEKKELFDFKIISYIEFFSSENEALLKNHNQVNTLIVTHNDFYKKIVVELDDYLQRIYNIPFKNLLFIYTDESFYEDSAILTGRKHTFYFSPALEYESYIHSFILYLSKVFSESVASFRLQDYITNSFEGVIHTEQLIKKNKEIEHLNDELKRLNNQLVIKNRIDALTNLYNRATIFDYLEQQRNRTNRDLWRIDKAFKSAIGVKVPQSSGNPYDYEPMGELLDHYGVLSLMMIDVDLFKNVNDTYGHLVGDEVLRHIGNLLTDKEVFREHDIAGRFGGEEFLVILPDTNVNNALGPALRFVKKLSEKEFSSPDKNKFHITVSIGISQSIPNDKTKEDIIRRTDQALYYAKEHGRNQIIIYEKVFKK